MDDPYEALDSLYPDLDFLKQSFREIVFPPHDPDRYETTDGLDNPGMTNGDRVEVAKRRLTEIPGDEEALGDLICYLLHLAHSMELDVAGIIEAGIGHFVAEAGPIEEDAAEEEEEP